jgi:hypothetical protein
VTRRAKSAKERDLAHLVAYDEGQQVVVELRFSFLEYYENSHAVIDNMKFRAKRRIRRIVGRLVNSEGMVTHEFEHSYSQTGELIASIARHDDGKVVRFPE